MGLPGAVRLSVGALGWLLRVERIGEPHLVVMAAAVWRAPADRGELEERAWKEVAALGWYDGRGRLGVEVGAALAMLCRAEVEFFGWVSQGAGTVGILAAGIGRHGLVAVREGDEVWLSWITRGTLAEALAAQTPDVSAGQGKPVVVSRAELIRRRITEPTAVRQVREIAGLPLLGKGELYAAVRSGKGRYRVSEPLRYADTVRGRYVNVAVGADEVLVAPAGGADVVSRLRELRRSLG